jgi:hypothetical protein
LGTTVIDQKLINEVINEGFNSGKTCYNSLQALLPSSLLSRNIKNKIYTTIAMYECQTWSPTLKEELRVTMVENRVLRRIFGQKRDEIVGGWIKLHNEELHNLYSSPEIIRKIKSRRIRWAGYIAPMEGKRHAYRLLMVKREGKRPPERHRSRRKILS